MATNYVGQNMDLEKGAENKEDVLNGIRLSPDNAQRFISSKKALQENRFDLAGAVEGKNDLEGEFRQLDAKISGKDADFAAGEREGAVKRMEQLQQEIAMFNGLIEEAVSRGKLQKVLESQQASQAEVDAEKTRRGEPVEKNPRIARLEEAITGAQAK